MTPPHGIFITCYNMVDDTYTLSDGSRISRYELMCNPQFASSPYLGSGAINGRYRQANTTAHSSSTVGAHQGNSGAQAIAAQQAALNAYSGQSITFTSTSSGGIAFPMAQAFPRPEIKYEGVIAGEIIAWRIWFVRSGILYSTYTGSVWDPETPMTGDPMGGWETHGVHAWKDKGEALKYALGFGNWPMAIGQVKLWGEVVEHDRGYRAENAKIIYIESVHETINKRNLKRLRKLYGVDGNAISDNNGKGKAPSERGQETLDDSGRSGTPLGRYARICRALFGRRELRDRL